MNKQIGLIYSIIFIYSTKYQSTIIKIYCQMQIQIRLNLSQLYIAHIQSHMKDISNLKRH